ncbi:MAG: PD-(D/E)XK nuclease domain-containing protein, partial [Gammaproteobacteria bacterium]|nr:PD-(D/E)XK nuclease domain-containing protein [Gammaproteobacteria bacterium]
VEDSSGRGRADMVALHGGQVFVFEFKMAGRGEGGKDAAQRAIGQMREKGYAEKYRGRGEPIHLVGVAFSREDRNLAAVKVAPA